MIGRPIQVSIEKRQRVIINNSHRATSIDRASAAHLPNRQKERLVAEIHVTCPEYP
jgi:hypothetical protein